ncbi:fimbrial biogenesis chaperone [Dyella sp. 20L07]|uniref:fimbrial biogenesis chaperone n=1 Tax=Dyella sp. 20L07 TaxID=3384240 RepID=UPI003D2E47EF
MKTPIRALAAALLTFCALSAAPTYANVIIAGTRVVFPAKDGEVTVRLTNDNTTPALIESWIDDGDEHSSPDKVHTPFVVTPPLFRMDAHKDQNLRILATANQLPADRESLFWLNVLEIPPKPTSVEMTGKNLLQFAFRSRLKLFYRPATLQGDPIKAPSELTWKAVPDAGGYTIEAHNPTPYYVTVVKLTVNVGGKEYINEAAGMVAPMSSQRLTIKGLSQAPAANTPVNYDIINDYGATASFKGSVSP